MVLVTMKLLAVKFITPFDTQSNSVENYSLSFIPFPGALLPELSGPPLSGESAAR